MAKDFCGRPAAAPAPKFQSPHKHLAAAPCSAQASKRTQRQQPKLQSAHSHIHGSACSSTSTQAQRTTHLAAAAPAPKPQGAHGHTAQSHTSGSSALERHQQSHTSAAAPCSTSSKAHTTTCLAAAPCSGTSAKALKAHATTHRCLRRHSAQKRPSYSWSKIPKRQFVLCTSVGQLFLYVLSFRAADTVALRFLFRQQALPNLKSLPLVHTIFAQLFLLANVCFEDCWESSKGSIKQKYKGVRPDMGGWPTPSSSVRHATLHLTFDLEPWVICTWDSCEYHMVKVSSKSTTLLWILSSAARKDAFWWISCAAATPNGYLTLANLLAAVSRQHELPYLAKRMWKRHYSVMLCSIPKARHGRRPCLCAWEQFVRSLSSGLGRMAIFLRE